jgi:hypothetical protein
VELEEEIINRYKLVRVTPSELSVIELNLKNLIEKFTNTRSRNIQKWEIGWKENLIEIINTNDFERALIPKYLTKSKNLRVNGKYYKTSHLNDIPVIHHHVVASLLRKLPEMDFDKIVELGAGSCNNAKLIHNLFPNTPLLLTDWSNESISIANHLTTLISNKISGAFYDFFALENTVDLSNCLVITVHSLEQIGNDMSVLERILEKKPKLILNIEPIVEDYEPMSESGSLLIKLHNRREYFAGFPSWLRNKAQSGKLRVLQSGKVRIGTEISEPYSFFIWEPTY